jgi:hypothetical protein
MTFWDLLGQQQERQRQRNSAKMETVGQLPPHPPATTTTTTTPVSETVDTTNNNNERSAPSHQKQESSPGLGTILQSPIDTTPSMIQHTRNSNPWAFWTPLNTATATTTTTPSSLIVKEEQDNNDTMEEQGNWIALPPSPQPHSEIKETSRALDVDFDAALGKDCSSSSSKDKRGTSTTTSTTGSITNSNNNNNNPCYPLRFVSIVKLTGFAILIAVIATSINKKNHHHRHHHHHRPATTGRDNEADEVHHPSGYTSSSKSLPQRVVPVSEGLCLSPLSIPFFSYQVSSSSMSTCQTIVPTTTTTTTTTTTLSSSSSSDGATHIVDMLSSLFFHWDKKQSSSSSSTSTTTTTKEQFFPQIDRSVRWIQKQVHQGWFTTNAALQRWAQILEHYKNERTRQRFGYRQATLVVPAKGNQQELLMPSLSSTPEHDRRHPPPRRRQV